MPSLVPKDDVVILNRERSSVSSPTHAPQDCGSANSLRSFVLLHVLHVADVFDGSPESGSTTIEGNDTRDADVQSDSFTRELPRAVLDIRLLKNHRFRSSGRVECSRWVSPQARSVA